MLVDKNNIKEEDRQLAISVFNKIKSGSFVIGNPGLGLKKTLKKLEEDRDSRIFERTDWVIKDTELESAISKTKAGIDGEIKLCDYLSKLIKYEDALEGIVAFASLSYDDGKDIDLGYIPDTDVLLVCGNNVLIIDAKNIKLKPFSELSFFDGCVVDQKGKLLIEVQSSEHIWRKALGSEVEITSIVCLISDIYNEIVEPFDNTTNMTLIHISSLRNVLLDWINTIQDKTAYLSILTEIAKCQIKEEKELGIDITSIKKQFNI